MNPTYLHFCSRGKKLIANITLIAALLITGQGFFSTATIAYPNSQGTTFTRQNMADAQNCGQGTAKTKSDLDQKFQKVVGTSVKQATTGIKSAVDIAGEAVEDLANPETKESARPRGNRAWRDMQILKDTAEDLGPN
ncbi:hypothetical protein ACSYAD_32755 [Acaryochloris marina NIES-2412]|uniref:hypothetical protein n=1 Tax=Acaryochloris marina TaxID=155978 RepID=UPI0040588505